MYLHQIAEVAALASAKSLHLIESDCQLLRHPLTSFWIHTMQCARRWTQHIDRWPALFASLPRAQRESAWEQMQSVLQEVFVAEILTRVWTGVLVAADYQRDTCVAEPIVRNALFGHMRARHAALHLLVNGPLPTAESLLPIDRVRRRAERWTDFLLGHLVDSYNLSDLAFDESRARDFGREQLSRHARAPNAKLWYLVLSGIRLSFRQSRPLPESIAANRAEIARSVWATFPAEAYCSDGPFKSIWHGRIERSGSRREGPPHLAARIAYPGFGGEEGNPEANASPGISFATLREHQQG